MIPRAALTAWRANAPWALDTQVEQDLVIARAVVELFRDSEVGRLVAFRGGTALHKLFLERPLRYSEDIDLVQVAAGPIGPVLDGVHQRLDPWLGRSQWKRGPGVATLYYRFASETQPVVGMRLKVEINTREHFSVLGLARRSFAVANPWFDGTAELTTYELDELLGTKLRALYQRKKGRDLFDLWAVSRAAKVDLDRVVACFRGYLEHEGRAVSRAEFEANIEEKLGDPDFGADVGPLITAEVDWDLDAAARYVRDEVIARLPGAPWKGAVSPSTEGSAGRSKTRKKER
jgi:predicted nucleotidyltransferase component of viral defense system